MPYTYRMTSRVVCRAQYHRQHCTLETFEQFGALYMQTRWQISEPAGTRNQYLWVSSHNRIEWATLVIRQRHALLTWWHCSPGALGYYLDKAGKKSESWFFQEKCFDVSWDQNIKGRRCQSWAKCMAAENPGWPPFLIGLPYNVLSLIKSN